MILKPQKPTWYNSATDNTPLSKFASIRSNHSTPPVNNPAKVSSERTQKQSVTNIPQRLTSNLTATKTTPLADITSLFLNLNTSIERSSLPTSQFTHEIRTPIRDQPRCHVSNLHVNLAKKFDAVTSSSNTISLIEPTNQHEPADSMSSAKRKQPPPNEDGYDLVDHSDSSHSSDHDSFEDESEEESSDDDTSADVHPNNSSSLHG
jgi:hypothetical protein